MKNKSDNIHGIFNYDKKNDIQNDIPEHKKIISALSKKDFKIRKNIEIIKNEEENLNSKRSYKSKDIKTHHLNHHFTNIQFKNDFFIKNLNRSFLSEIAKDNLNDPIQPILRSAHSKNKFKRTISKKNNLLTINEQGISEIEPQKLFNKTVKEDKEKKNNNKNNNKNKINSQRNNTNSDKKIKNTIFYYEENKDFLLIFTVFKNKKKILIECLNRKKMSQKDEIFSNMYEREGRGSCLIAA